MGPLRIINTLTRLACPGSLWFKESLGPKSELIPEFTYQRGALSVNGLEYPICVIL